VKTASRQQTAAREPAIELLCAGTELLAGKTNTHSAFIARRLRAAGLRLARATSLPDDPALLAEEIRAALGRCDALLVCGGMGPTFDDVTREAAAAALGRDLVFHPRLFTAIRRKFSRLRFPLPRENRRQAFLVRGAMPLANRVGSAPGQLLALRRAPGRAPQTLALLPGPPDEMAPMLDEAVMPRLRGSYARGRHAASLTLHLCGLPESVADEKLRPVTNLAGPELDFTILASAGQVDFHAFSRCARAARARRLIARVRRLALRRVGPHVFGEGPQTLESAVAGRLRRRRLTLAVAESCSAGMLAARLTSVPGSSTYFRGGVLAYHDRVKQELLGVRDKTLSRHGAVSMASAREMAEGARRALKAGVGVALTGIAGPGGGGPRKPVGLTFIAISGPGRGSARLRLMLTGDRETIRQKAVAAALKLLWSHLQP